MLKAYTYTLDIVFIIDTSENTIYTAYPHELMKQEIDRKKMRITKATISKHVKDQGFVISPAIVENYAPEHAIEGATERQYIGEFADLSELSKFVKSIWDETRQLRDEYHFVNFGADLWDVVIALRQGKTEAEYNKYGKKHENEMALFRLLSKEREIYTKRNR